MEKNYRDLFYDIVAVVRRDYAGTTLFSDRFHPRYYNQSVGQAFQDGKLDDLLFLRYMSQMLACMGDRHLHLTLCTSDSYTPWTPGFFTRRHGDFLYVTHVTGDSRFTPGDRICAINGGTILRHRELFQQNFLYGETPDREDWGGVLKMADTVDVIRQDGSTETLTLEKHDPCAPALVPELRELPGNVVYCRPGAFDGSAGALAERAAALLTEGAGLILDLRNGRGSGEEDIYPYLSLVCTGETPLSQLLDTELSVNYTRLNCILKAAGLQDVPGTDRYIEELKKRSDTGFTTEEDDLSGESVHGVGRRPVVVLTDTWCRDGAETLALAAKRAGAYLMGRPTLGTVDFCGDVSLELNERFVLTWPTAVAARAFEGNGLTNTGVTPDELIDWTPAELERDLLLESALAYIRCHNQKNIN